MMGPAAYFSLCLLGYLSFNPSLAEEEEAPCPKDWQFIEGACYRYFSQQTNWTNAEAECQNHCGAHLASIENDKENNMLACYIKKSPPKGSVWIGLSGPDKSKKWRWQDASSSSFTAWDEGQPDCCEQQEHCAVLEDKTGFQKWHDYACKNNFSFVCKF